ncbi:hypothetical protein CANARDRAFT_7843 [[Candida] arabinofermentans NRRL YB-2248]|uniref:EamA domain-containing protein n=1 Tax=[Candida] arabinofermentans NRRL YB-2248 TaxID=983967 RepID=A0A1E4T0D6_9ASCO|nr:hypothetical protein CANARDRAFT_7843 [[Candida] arabinofermentans NRRL YB-2248]
MGSKYTILIFVAGTIIAGCGNSIVTKYQDLQCVRYCEVPGKEEYFEEPVLQTLQMFVGEMLCWLPVFLNFLRRSSFARGNSTNKRSDEQDPLLGRYSGAGSPSEGQIQSVFVSNKRQIGSFRDSFILAIPSICDLTATTLLNVGLLYTPVSIYQMTRGAIILFVGLFSVAFLKKHISRIEWMSLFIVFFGIFLVGLAGSIGSHDSDNSHEDRFTAGEIIFGMALIFVGIMFSATQFVVEEHILEHLDVRPLNLVGYEGLYGASLTFLFMIVTYALIGSRSSGKEGSFDMVYTFKLMFGNSNVLISSLIIMLFMSSFNYFGITLTEQLSATARSTIDTSRTLLVWLVSLAIGWESFKFLQLVGFVLLAYGTLVFNGVIILNDSKYLPSWLKKDPPTRDQLISNAENEPVERL